MAVHLPHLSMKLTNYLTIDLTSNHLSRPLHSLFRITVIY
jgi:hypothetical protein